MEESASHTPPPSTPKTKKRKPHKVPPTPEQIVALDKCHTALSKARFAFDEKDDRRRILKRMMAMLKGMASDPTFSVRNAKKEVGLL